MTDFLIKDVRLLIPGEGVHAGYLQVRGGKIIALGEGAVLGNCGAGEELDGGGALLTPGLIDMHTHGIAQFNYDQGPEHLSGAAMVLGKYGCTTVVPTMVPALGATFFSELDAFTQAIPSIKTVSIPGIHLEGPFVAITGAACETRDGDLGLLEELLSACNNRVAVMSISPEVKNIIPVIERLVERGIKPFITHTRASVEETLAAMDAGAYHGTHFYDVFPVPEETDPGVRPVGVVETILGDKRGTCDFICDGIHVHPMAIRAAVAAKGTKGVSLITDASFGAGLGPGMYDTPWGYAVEVKPGDAPRIADATHPMQGGLAGSALTMDQGMRNLLDWLDVPEADIWAMGTTSPAAVLGLSGKGKMAVGGDADLVLWDESLTAKQTWLAGDTVYKA